jgi:L-amino acid N-acyltransferase YncA
MKDIKISAVVSKFNAEDWMQVREIYAQGIATGVATFETQVPEWEEWNKLHFSYCRLVVRQNNKILAWAALSPISERCIYGGVAEVSIYVSQNWRSKGIGTLLLKALITESENKGIWTLQASIFPENKNSLNLHLKCGFRIIGVRKKLGKHKGVWRDVLFLERRSRRVGID